MIDTVSVLRLSAHIDSLQRAGGHRSRANFTPGLDSAVAYVQRQFGSMRGLSSVRLDTFYVPSAVPPFDTKPMFNVVGTLQGKKNNGKTIVIGAHIDACGSRTPEWNQQWNTMAVPGADDNASGISVVLELARILSDTSFGFANEQTIVFAAFGVEETGPAYTGYLYGSNYFAQQAKARGDDITAMLCVDMVGFNDNNLYLNIVTNEPSKWLSAHILSVNDGYSIGMNAGEASMAYTWSDHAPFWNQGFPAVCLIESAPPTVSHQFYTANTYFHTSGDSLGTLNMTLVQRSAQLTLAACATLAASLSPVKQINTGIPESFVLEQNYPNPFNPVTTVTFSIPAEGSCGTVSLRVFDALGRTTAALVNEHKEPGTYSVRFNASHIPSGVYFYRLEAGRFSATKRMIVVQ